MLCIWEQPAWFGSASRQSQLFCLPQTHARVQTLLFGQGAVGQSHQLCLCMCLLHVSDAFWQGVGVHELKLGVLAASAIGLCIDCVCSTASIIGHNRCGACMASYGETDAACAFCYACIFGSASVIYNNSFFNWACTVHAL